LTLKDALRGAMVTSLLRLRASDPRKLQLSGASSQPTNVNRIIVLSRIERRINLNWQKFLGY
jgi:hypothetical protein